MSNEPVYILSLENAVSINEILKKVIDIARQIDLVALNAVLIAKRAGSESAGFHVVALELRSFGLKIEQEMAVLERLIQVNVLHIAALLKLKKNLSLLNLAMTKNGQAKLLLQDSYAMAEKNLQKAMAVSHPSWDRLARDIRMVFTGAGWVPLKPNWTGANASVN